jgi:hypothetical protein
MVQIVNRVDPWENLGSGLGQGIGSGLSALLEHKVNEISINKATKDIKDAFPGVDEKQVRLAAKDPDFRKEFYKQQSKMASNIAYNNSINKAQQSFQQPQSQQQNFAQPTQAPIGAAINEQQQLLQQHEPSSALGQLYQEAGLPLGTETPQNAQAQFQQQPQEQPVEAQPQQQQPAEKPKNIYRAILETPDLPLDPKERATFEKLAQKQDHFLKKEERAERKESREDEKIRRESFSESAKERSELLSSGRQSRENLKELGDLEDLEKSGNLDTPGYVSFLERSGFDIPALMNPESEAFQKITTLGMFRGLKDATRGQITNREVEGFAKTIPSLLQSPEGRKRVTSGMKYINRINLAYTDGLKGIVEESVKNKEPLPVDWREQLDTKVEKQIDTLVKKFKEDLAKPVPKGQNKLITALQAGAGDLVGSIPSLAKTAGKVGLGAFGGSKFGVPGAVIGGLGGLLV